MASDQQQFFARYPGELTDEDRSALSRPGFRLYENGLEISDGYFVSANEPPPESTVYQVVRLSAASPEDARRQIVDALGREPDDLQIDEAKSTG